MNARVIGALSIAIAAGCTRSIPIEQLPGETAAALCANSPACLGRLATQVDVPGSCESAYEGFTANAVIPLWQAAIERGTMTYDGAAAATCLDEIRALGCDVSIAAEPASCRGRTVGTIALGEPCSLSEECAGDAYCDGASCPEEPGTCIARRADGEDCTSDGQCREGLDCEGGVCRAPASMSGGSCGGDAGLSCPLDERCVIASGEDTGTCRPWSELLTRTLGEACDPSAYELCAPELSCAAVEQGSGGLTYECVAVASSGASCFAGLPSMCPAGEHCTADVFSGVLEGTCQPLPQANEPCGTGGVCAPGLQCRWSGAEGMCVRLKDNGEACESGGECHSSRCEGGVCAPPELCPA